MKSTLLLVCAIWSLGVAFRVQADNDALGDANIGERFFLETRFAQFFFTNSGGKVNFTLTNGDPVMNVTASIYGPLPGPFAGQSMNCRACHLVQEQENTGNRTYCDFAQRSPIPANGDGRAQTPRNAIDLVNSLLPHSTPLFLHYDGQFATPQDLIIATLTGRNYGWKPTEYATAMSHIVNIVRNDDGSGGLAQQYGGVSYAHTLAADLPQIESQYRITDAYRLFDVTVTNTADPNYVSDDRIIADIAALIQAYMETLVFSQDTSGQFNGSPYDVFLIKNGLPRSPAANESPVQYSQRLLQLIENLPNPQYVSDPADGHFATHDQLYKFGPTEMAGLKIFFTKGGKQGVTGNCVACHSPPDFTDFLFHNTGAAQEEYDSIHGAGSFMNLTIPGLCERQTNYEAYLPPTPNHPNALGTFITSPSLPQPGQVDLGLWNVFANPDFPAPQAGLQQILPQLIPTPPSPQISGATMITNDFIFSGTNGPPGWTYNVLASTNLMLPKAGWNIISTNTFDAQGHFSVTNVTLPNPGEYYQLSVGGPSPAIALPLTIALFKTPNLRDLGSSEPYLHTGRMDSIEAVISFYQNFSGLSRSGLVRNGDPRLGGISLDNSAGVPLAAFLRSLNEDYFDVPCPCQ